MAYLNSTKVTIVISELLKDNEKSEQLIQNHVLGDLDEVIKQLVGKENILVEITIND